MTNQQARPDWEQVFDKYAKTGDSIRASRAHLAASSADVAWMAAEEDWMARFIFRELPIAGRVLDIGCGSGEFYRRLPVAFTGEYTGVDLSAGMLDLFRKQLAGCEQINLIHGDIENAALVSSHFDFVMAIGVLPYVARARKPTYLGAVNRLLKPGGHLVFDFFNYRDGDLGDDWGMPFDLAMSMLSDAGFAVRQVTAFVTLATSIGFCWRPVNVLDRFLQLCGFYASKWICRRLGYRVCICAQKVRPGEPHTLATRTASN